MSRGLRPSYSGGPISSVEALERFLDSDIATVNGVLANIEQHYRLVQIPKPDGRMRECWDPSKELRSLQKRVVKGLFRRVAFPGYLHGSLPKRDYVSNAEAHRNARWGVTLDIKTFFPRITEAHVRDVLWRGFFGAPPQIAQLLAGLTTLRGSVPQGSLTASYLANLAFWRDEHALVQEFESKNFIYTRYVDDITVTTDAYPAPAEKTLVVGRLNAFLRRNGFVQKRPKTKILTRSRGIEVLGLTVGAKVGRSKEIRRALETEILGLPGLAQNLSANERTARITRLKGRLIEMARYHKREATHLQELMAAYTREED